MDSPDPTRLRDLIDRLTRLAAATDWRDGLNPAQRSALAYLDRANRFSRAPSHVADYLCTTRGTASQTLKALERKGLIAPVPSATDRRSLSFEITDAGREVLGAAVDFDAALGSVRDKDIAAVERGLEQIVGTILSRRQFRAFGLCRTCAHHLTSEDGRHCALLNVALQENEADQLCHEHTATGH